MVIRTPPQHNVIDPPAQIVNDLSSTLVQQASGQITLEDYLEKKYPEEMKKKLSFDEWYRQYDEKYPYVYEWGKYDMESAWLAGQENK